MSARGRRSIAIGIAAIVALVVLVHGRVARFGFVFDDRWTIEHNQALGGPLRPILAAVLHGTARRAGIPDATRPTMIASTWIDRHLFGLAHPGAFHVHSLLLYLFVCVLAGWVVLLLVGRRRAVFVGALFFAMAPIHGEVIAAINYREDLLSALGVLVTIGALLAPAEARVSAFVTASSTIVFGLALGAKESTLCAIPLLVALVAIRGIGASDTSSPWGFIRRRETPLIALALVIVAYLNWRLSLGAASDDLPRAPLVSPFVRLCDTARFETIAVARGFVPIGWSPDPARPAAASAWWLGAVSLLVALVVLLARRITTRAIAIAITVAMLAPIVASPAVGPFNAYADRYFFLSVLGGAIFWSWMFARVSRRAPRLAVGCAIASIGLLSWDAFHASGAFRDDRTLWTTAVERDESSPRAWVALSRVHRHDGDLVRADAAVARALALDPRYPSARLALVYNHLARGDVVSANVVLDDLTSVADEDLTGLRRARLCAAGPASQASSCALQGYR